jgi:hypothetical protein
VRICIDRATDETDVITDEASSARKEERERNSEELHIEKQMKQRKRHVLERKRKKETVWNYIDRATDETDVITDDASSARKEERERNSVELQRKRAR